MSVTIDVHGNDVAIHGVIRVTDYAGSNLDESSGSRIANDIMAVLSGATTDLQGYFNGQRYNVTSDIKVVTQDGPGVVTYIIDPNMIHGAFASSDSETIYVQVDNMSQLNPVNSSKYEDTWAHEFLHRSGSGDTPRLDGDIMDSGTGRGLSTLDIDSIINYNYWQNYGQNTVNIYVAPSVAATLNVRAAEGSFVDINNIIYQIVQQGRAITNIAFDFSRAVSDFVGTHNVIQEGGSGDAGDSYGFLGDDGGGLLTWVPGSDFNFSDQSSLGSAYGRTAGGGATLGDGGTIWNVGDPFAPDYYLEPHFTTDSAYHPQAEGNPEVSKRG